MGNMVEDILGGIMISFTCHLIWKKFLNIKYFNNFIKFFISFIIMILSVIINYYFNNNYIRIISVTLLYIIVIRLLYNKDLKKCVIVGIMTELLFIVSELVFSVIMLIIFRSNLELVMTKYFGSLLTNFMVCLITILLSIISIVKKLYNKFLVVTDKLKISNVLVMLTILIVSFNIFLMLPYYKVDTLIIVILNAFTMGVYSYIVFRFIKEKNRYIEISDKYSLTETSLKELQNNVNRLMTINHENKNQLKTIRNMVASKDKNTLKTLDIMIEEKVKNDKQLKEKTSVLANTMLGALIYSKLLTMKENKIHHDLHIERTITKIEFINLGEETNIDICKIVGVYLDNAIEATMETIEKDVSIQIYLEDEEIVICIANTFVGDIDLNAIYNYGYTTKSDGHGFGLSLVKEILKENKNLNSETEVSNNIFIQKLKIKSRH